MPKYIFSLDMVTNCVIPIEEVTPNNRHLLQLVCLECKQPVIPKIGVLRTHHFSHKNKGLCLNICNINQGESYKHRYCKQQLCKFINNGGQIISVLRCCNIMTKIAITPKFKAVMEYSIPQGGIADIAIISEEKIHYIIEIMNTHRTYYRVNQWSEFYYRDVLEELRKKEPSIILNNIRNCPCYQIKLNHLKVI